MRTMSAVVGFTATALSILLSLDVRAAEVPAKKDGLGPYVGIYGGVVIPETFDNVTITGQGIGSRSAGDLKLKTGSIFGAKWGLMGHSKDAVWRYFGAEVDLSVVSTALCAQPLRISGSGGVSPLPQTDIRFLTGALHLLFKWPDGPLQPYASVPPWCTASLMDLVCQDSRRRTNRRRQWEYQVLRACDLSSLSSSARSWNTNRFGRPWTSTMRRAMPSYMRVWPGSISCSDAGIDAYPIIG